MYKVNPNISNWINFCEVDILQEHVIFDTNWLCTFRYGGVSEIFISLRWSGDLNVLPTNTSKIILTSLSPQYDTMRMFYNTTTHKLKFYIWGSDYNYLHLLESIPRIQNVTITWKTSHNFEVINSFPESGYTELMFDEIFSKKMLNANLANNSLITTDLFQ